MFDAESRVGSLRGVLPFVPRLTGDGRAYQCVGEGASGDEQQRYSGDERNGALEDLKSVLRRVLGRDRPLAARADLRVDLRPDCGKGPGVELPLSEPRAHCDHVRFDLPQLRLDTTRIDHVRRQPRRQRERCLPEIHRFPDVTLLRQQLELPVGVERGSRPIGLRIARYLFIDHRLVSDQALANDRRLFEPMRKLFESRDRSRVGQELIDDLFVGGQTRESALFDHTPVSGGEDFVGDLRCERLVAPQVSGTGFGHSLRHCAGVRARPSLRKAETPGKPMSAIVMKPHELGVPLTASPVEKLNQCSS